MPAPEQMPLPDPLAWLAYVAAVTKTIKLATGILILPQRHPIYVAKEVATIDVLSNGRVILGIGVGWLEEEFVALDVPFAERAGRTAESVRALRALWRDEPATVRGQVLSLAVRRVAPEAGAEAGRADRRRRPHRAGRAPRRALRRRLLSPASRTTRSSPGSSASCARSARRSAATRRRSR
jgi:hypothetical protein